MGYQGVSDHPLTGRDQLGEYVPDDHWDKAPVGMAVVDARGRLSRLNAVGASLLGVSVTADLASPFEVEPRAACGEAVDEERLVTLGADTGVTREIAYRVRYRRDDVLVAFRDVTSRRRQERRAAAVARSAARVASERSLETTLSAMAKEILRATGLAGVQVLTVDGFTRDLQVMGSAGFDQSEDFFARLMECKRRGASLKTFDAFDTRQYVVVNHRYEEVMEDSAWEPLQDQLRHPRWDSFASMPLIVRGRSVGVLNAFFSPGQTVSLEILDFLATMAEQAAMAIDYAALLEQERRAARRTERQRLARDLHDSVVQQVFSIGLQTESLKLLAERAPQMSADRVKPVVNELEEITRSVLADLRSLVDQLHAGAQLRGGLLASIKELVASTRRRSGIGVTLRADPVIDRMDSELAGDVYFVLAEAVHNAVKHSGADRIDVVVECDGSTSTLVMAVEDNGGGMLGHGHGDGRGGYGLTSMRERVAAWNGRLAVRTPRDSEGTLVRARIPAVPTLTTEQST